MKASHHMLHAMQCIVDYAQQLLCPAIEAYLILSDSGKTKAAYVQVSTRPCSTECTAHGSTGLYAYATLSAQSLAESQCVMISQLIKCVYV